MKKEILYIIIPVILCVAGLMFKSFFLSDTLKDTQQILDLSNDLNAKFNKDSLVQNNVEGMKALYEKNKRGDQKIISYGEIITNIIQELEVMLKKSGIEYRANDINQDLEEVVKSNLGISCFYINISLSSNYEKIKKLLMLMDQSEYVTRASMLLI